VREWYEEDASHAPDKLRDIDFGKWQGRRRKKIVLSISEDQLFDALRSVAIGLFAQGNYIVSSSFGSVLPDDH
jgi:hypothetical protein